MNDLMVKIGEKMLIMYFLYYCFLDKKKILLCHCIIMNYCSMCALSFQEIGWVFFFKILIYDPICH